jgi:divalent metal cation (Fe/Co/Zn/Cd) transporter
VSGTLPGTLSDQGGGLERVPDTASFVWFFVGIILLIYGVLILATGIYEFSNPPATILANLHPALWWGALLMILGGIFVYVHLPRKS